MKNLANKPRDFEVKINEINIRYTEFNNRIKEILDVKDNNSILDILGTKTQFWEVSFNTEYSN